MCGKCHATYVAFTAAHWPLHAPEKSIQKYGAPVYVRHEIVHNTYVVNDLKQKGAIFIEDLDEVPAGATLVFSAHGVSRAIQDEAKARGFSIFDATCPLVAKVHVEVAKLSKEGYEFLMIGHKGHPEVEGTMGQYNRASGGDIYLVEDQSQASSLNVADPGKLSYVTQTTLSMDDTALVIDALRQRFPHIEGPRKNDICYATQNRQDAVKQLAADCDLMLVVGSPNSSNSNRLRELAERMGAEAHLLDGAQDIDPRWVKGKRRIGVTAGASAPEVLVQEVIDGLRALGAEAPIEVAGQPENVTFSLPKELRIEVTNL